ncbi:MAG: hypothetical protein J4G17_04025 [Anaerolineae bacterium]|nr:hypothetical protein [Anaerolineae bacterium]
MERVGDMTREELKAPVSEVIEEKLEHAIGENGVARNFLDAGLEGPDRSEVLQSIRRSSQKISRPHNSWTNPVMEEREAHRKRSWVEICAQVDRIGWTPPPDVQSPLKLLREDRDG